MGTKWNIYARSSAELKQVFGTDGMTVDNYCDKLQKDLWLLRRYIFTLADNDKIKYPIRIIHQTGTGESDFYLETTNTEPPMLELTEATYERDAKERAKLRNSPQGTVIAIGDCGGRGKGGMQGDEPERMLVEDLCAAIRRKLKKRYAKRMHLLIYANSNATKLIFDKEVIRSAIDHYFRPLLNHAPELKIPCSVILDNILVHDVTGNISFLSIKVD